MVQVQPENLRVREEEIIHLRNEFLYLRPLCSGLFFVHYFNFINFLHEQCSLIITTNKSPTEWAQVLDDEVFANYSILAIKKNHLFGYNTKQKPLQINRLRGVLSTRSRDRTGMEVNPLVFETSASTNSAIRANADAKVSVFL
jgi:hypothetical protein